MEKIRKELKEELMEYTVYSIVEGDEDFQTAYDYAVKVLLELNETEKRIAEKHICNNDFVKACYDKAAEYLD